MGEISLTEEELEELKDIFAMFDKDNSGSIDVNELESMVSSLGSFICLFSNTLATPLATV